MFAGEMTDGEFGRTIPWKRQRIFRKIMLSRQIAKRWQQCFGGCFADCYSLDDRKIMKGAFWFRHVDVADGTVGGAEVDTDEKTAWGDGFSGFHRWGLIILR